MTLPYLAGTAAQSEGSGAVETLTMSVQQAVPAGDLLILVVGSGGGGTCSSVTDSQSNVYANPGQVSDQFRPIGYAWSVLTHGLSTSDTVTTTFSASIFPVLTGVAVPGGTGIASAAGTGNAASAAVSILTGTGLPGDFVVGAAITGNGNGGITINPPWQPLAIAHGSGQPWLVSSWRYNPTAGPVSMNGSLTAGGGWDAEAITASGPGQRSFSSVPRSSLAVDLAAWGGRL